MGEKMKNVKPAVLFENMLFSHFANSAALLIAEKQQMEQMRRLMSTPGEVPEVEAPKKSVEPEESDLGFSKEELMRRAKQAELDAAAVQLVTQAESGIDLSTSLAVVDEDLQRRTDQAAATLFPATSVPKPRMAVVGPGISAAEEQTPPLALPAGILAMRKRELAGKPPVQAPSVDSFLGDAGQEGGASASTSAPAAPVSDSGSVAVPVPATLAPPVPAAATASGASCGSSCASISSSSSATAQAQEPALLMGGFFGGGSSSSTAPAVEVPPPPPPPPERVVGLLELLRGPPPDPPPEPANVAAKEAHKADVESILAGAQQAALLTVSAPPPPSSSVAAASSTYSTATERRKRPEDAEAAPEEASELRRWVEQIKTGSEVERYNAVRNLWDFARGKPANKTAVAQAGAIGPIVEMLVKGSDDDKEVCIGALGNIARGNVENREIMVTSGAWDVLKTLQKSGTDKQKEDAARALREIEGGSSNQARKPDEQKTEERRLERSRDRGGQRRAEGASSEDARSRSRGKKEATKGDGESSRKRNRDRDDDQPDRPVLTGATVDRRRRSGWDDQTGAQGLPMQKASKPPPVSGAGNHKVLRLKAPQIRALLGKGGQTVNMIRARTGADIKIHHPPQDEYGSVSVVGNVEYVEQLVSEACAAKGFPIVPDHMTGATPELEHKEEVYIPAEMVRLLVGQSNQTEIRVGNSTAAINVMPTVANGLQRLQVTGVARKEAVQLLKQKVSQLRRMAPTVPTPGGFV